MIINIDPIYMGTKLYVDGLVRDCSNSDALVLQFELSQCV